MTPPPATTEWVRELLAQEIDKAVAPLRQEIDQLDDWANGVFAALEDSLRVLLVKHPGIAAELAPLWRDAAEQFDKLGSSGQSEDFHQTQELLEARKMLYRQLALLHVWPLPGAVS